MEPSGTRPGRESETSSGFAFDFQIPAAADPGTGGADAKPTTKKKKKEKKKKKQEEKPGGGENICKLREEEQESTALTPEQQLSRELDWCIEQLELGLRTQKSSSKQREEASRALKTLRSSKAPMVKKRQVMRAVSGDYRKKMEEERDRQHKLIRSAMSSATVARVSDPCRGAAFHRHAASRAPDVGLPAEQTDSNGFVLRPSGQEFRFNFDL